MKELILKLVTTNSGWIARRLVMYSAVLAAVITGYLKGKGYDADTSAMIAAAVVSVAFGAVELGLSFVARKYKVEEAERLKDDIEQLRGAQQPPTTKLPLILGALLCVTVLPSCEQVKALIVANEPLIEEALVYGLRAGVKTGVRKLEPAAKQPRTVQP